MHLPATLVALISLRTIGLASAGITTQQTAGPTTTTTTPTAAAERRWEKMSPGEGSWVLCLHIWRVAASPMPDINDQQAFDKAVRWCAGQYGDEWMAYNRVYVEHQTWDNIFPEPDLVKQAEHM